MWRVLYPCGIHFLISQIVGYAALAVICYSMGYGLEFYQSQTILMTGITALLTMIPCIWFYQKDKSARIVGDDSGAAGKEAEAWRRNPFTSGGSVTCHICQYAGGFVAKCSECTGISGKYGTDHKWKKLVYAHLLDGSDRAACRGDCFSLADLSAAERLYQGGNGGSDIRSIFSVFIT